MPAPPSLPSATAANAAICGRPGGIPATLATAGVRTAMVAVGLSLAGRRRDVWRVAAGGVAALEALILGELYLRGPECNGHGADAPPMPTAEHATRLLGGDLTAAGPVALDVALRAAVFAVGMGLAGAGRRTLRDAVAGSLAVEAFVIAWAAYQRGQASPEASTHGR